MAGVHVDANEADSSWVFSNERFVWVPENARCVESGSYLNDQQPSISILPRPKRCAQKGLLGNLLLGIGNWSIKGTTIQIEHHVASAMGTSWYLLRWDFLRLAVDLRKQLFNVRTSWKDTGRRARAEALNKPPASLQRVDAVGREAIRHKQPIGIRCFDKEIPTRFAERLQSLVNRMLWNMGNGVGERNQVSPAQLGISEEVRVSNELVRIRKATFDHRREVVLEPCCVVVVDSCWYTETSSSSNQNSWTLM